MAKSATASKLALVNENATQAQQAFVTALQNKMTDFLGSQLDGPFSVVNYTSGFNYMVQWGPNNYYNEATISSVDQLVAAQDNGIESLTGQRFSTLYQNILQNVVYKISSADQKTIDQAQTQFAAQMSAVIQTFENDMGTITVTEITSSKCVPASKIGYVAWFVQQYYGGDPTKIPVTLADFRGAYQAFLNVAALFLSITTRATNAASELAAALANTTTPSAANGGLQTGASSYDVGYGTFPAVNDIVAALDTATNQVEIDCTLTNFTSTESTLNVEGSAGFTIPLPFISIGFGASANYSLYQYSGSASAITISIVYPGLTKLRLDPVPLTQDLSAGWYDSNLLQEVVMKTGKDITGFQLQGGEFSVPDLFGQGKQFARVRTFVVSQVPTIKLKFTGANLQTVRSNFKQNASVSLNLFDIFPIGSASESYQVQNIDSSSSDGSVTVTLGPPVPSGTVPVQQATAYVVGGVIDYPPGR
jgi:hypothetical protein